MNTLNQIKRITGAQAALGVSVEKGMERCRLPHNFRVIGCTETVSFCCIEGYLNTVFAVRMEKGLSAVPVAYCVEDFIRLILSCGCAQAVAEGVVLKSRLGKMEKLGTLLKLKPMTDPLGYIQTVNQVIDCSRILLKVPA